MSLFKKAMYLFILLIAFYLISCNSLIPKKQLPASKPKDFNFVFNYGVNARNKLDTFKGEYTKDMVIEPSITVNLKLSDEEMDSIYSEMKRINILDYPEEFKPKSNFIQTPYYMYSIKITADGVEKDIFWSDRNVSDANKAVKLRELFKKIEEIINNKDEYKKLPHPKSVYQ